MGQEDAYQSSPQEAGPPTKQKGKQQRESDPHQEGATDKEHHGISKQVPRIDSGVCFTIFEQPAQMSVEEALHRTMGIAFAISLGMMPGVPGEAFSCDGNLVYILPLSSNTECLWHSPCCHEREGRALSPRGTTYAISVSGSFPRCPLRPPSPHAECELLHV